MNSLSTADRQRWESIRRAFLAIVAQQEAVAPDTRYTLAIRIVEKQATDKVA